MPPSPSPSARAESPAPRPVKGLAMSATGTVLLLAMALPMLILYATGSLGAYVSADLGVAVESLGYLVLASFGLAALLSLFAGSIVDRLGLRVSFALHFFAVALSFLLISRADSLPLLAASVAICGLSQATANPVTNQLIALRIPPAKRAGMVGLKQSGVQLAALFAGLVLPVIASGWGWRAAFLSLVPAALLGALAAAALAPPRVAHRARLSLAPPNRPLVLLMLAQGCIGAVLSAYVTAVPAFGISLGLGPREAAQLVALFGVTGMLSRIALTPIAARFDNQALCLLALVAVAIAAVCVTASAAADHLWLLYTGVAGIGLSIVASNAIAMGMLVKGPEFGSVTQASGMVSAAFFSGLACGSLLFGQLAANAGYLSGWLGLVVLLVLSGLLCGLLAEYLRRNLPGEAQPQ